jgi:hypothetical protein
MFERFDKRTLLVAGMALLMAAATALFLQAGLELSLAFNSFAAMLILGLMYARSRSNLAYRRIKIDQNRLRQRSGRGLR